MMSAKEEAGIRMALAEREQRLAALLLSTEPKPGGWLTEQRKAIEELRKQLNHD